MSKTILSEEIIELKQQGFSYALIAKTLDCSKSTVAYHCGTGQKDKAKSRTYRSRHTRKAKSEYNTIRNREFSWRYKKLCGCKHCGIKNPVVLDYDHKDGTDKTCAVSNMLAHRYSLSVIKQEIRKCIVLCANCHRIRTAKQFGWYKNLI